MTAAYAGTGAGHGIAPVDEPIPLARPVLGAREQERVLDVLRSGRLSLGPLLGEFERAFADRLGAGHASAVSKLGSSCR